MPGPQVCVGGCLRVVTRGTAVGGRFRGASGTPPPTACPGMGGSGSLPSSGPAGPPSPKGEGKGCSGGIHPSRGVLAGGFAGRRGRRPLRLAREWAAAGASPSSGPAGPPSPKGEGKGCCWRQRKVSRDVGDAAPYGLPGNGQQREPAPHPALRGHLPPRGKARAVIPPGVLAQAFAGRRGRRPLRFAREWAAAGACPSSGPAGPPSPKGEGKGCCWRQREVAAG